MPRKKSEDSFLTLEEQADFKRWADLNKITFTKMAEIQGTSVGTISSWFKKGTVLKALKENVECRLENKNLKQTLSNVKNSLK